MIVCMLILAMTCPKLVSLREVLCTGFHTTHTLHCHRHTPTLGLVGSSIFPLMGPASYFFPHLSPQTSRCRQNQKLHRDLIPRSGGGGLEKGNVLIPVSPLLDPRR